MINGDQMEPLTFSVVPSRLGGVHAVLDGVIRAAYHDPGGVPRPGPGSPMLRELAELHAELTR